MATEWYLRSGSTVTGPLSTDQLKAMGKSGRVTEGMEVSKDASGPWHRASGVNGIYKSDGRIEMRCDTACGCGCRKSLAPGR